MADFDWLAFMQNWRKEALPFDGSFRFLGQETPVATEWMGYEGASPKAIQATEARLGMTLPPSYKQFLLATNG